MNSEYTFKEVQNIESELQQLAKLIKLGAPKATFYSAEYLKWMYFENPVGDVIGINTLFENKIVAHIAALPARFMVNGVEKKGVTLVNASTHPQHRRSGLFVKSGLAMFERIRELGYEFAIVSANANSSEKAAKYLGLELIAPLEQKIGIGKKLIRDEKSYGFHRLWNKEEMQWRLNRPASEYTVNKSAVFSSIFMPFFKVFLGNINPESTPEHPIKKFNPLFRPLNLYIGAGLNFKNGIYINVPKFMKTSPFNLMYKDLTGNNPIPKKEEILFRLMDFDVI